MIIPSQVRMFFFDEREKEGKGGCGRGELSRKVKAEVRQARRVRRNEEALRTGNISGFHVA